MGGRTHGTWAKVYADVWVHPKTTKLARDLEALGVPARWSRDVAVGQLHRLACALAALTDDGAVGQLAPQEFCSLIGWSDHRKADSVLAAWLSSGFIDNPGTQGATLHGFDEFFGELVRKRAARRARNVRPVSGQRPPDGRTLAAGRPTVGPHKSESENYPPNPLAREGGAPPAAGPDGPPPSRPDPTRPRTARDADHDANADRERQNALELGADIAAGKLKLTPARGNLLRQHGVAIPKVGEEGKEAAEG